MLQGGRHAPRLLQRDILRRAERLAKEEQDVGREVVLYGVGRKAELYFRWRGTPLERVWTGMSDQPTYANSAEIGHVVTEAYTAERLDRVWMAYTDFRSALSQVASIDKSISRRISSRVTIETDAGASLIRCS